MLQRVRPALKREVRSMARQEGAAAAATTDTNDDEDGDHSRLCSICWERPKEVVLVPCMHANLCRQCGDAIGRNGAGEQAAKCPTCRKNIANVVRIFDN